jgi:hypothetical protein
VTSATIAQSANTVRHLRASQVKPRPVQWLWPDRIPLGALTVLAGEPGLGKSLLTTLLAAQLSRGELTREPGASLFLTAEDSLDYTVVPRLTAADADLEQIAFPPTGSDGIDQSLRLSDNLDWLDELVSDSAAKLVVFDPLVAFLPGKVNSWNDQSVRGALAPLANFAAKVEAAVLAVVHLNKSNGADPFRRVGGSIAFGAAARSMLLLSRDPDDPAGVSGAGRVLAQAKSNVGKLATSLAYRIEERTLETDSSSGDLITSPYLVQAGSSRFTAVELLALNEPEARSKLTDAVALLQSELADGPKAVVELRQAARELDISVSTLERAKQQLNVDSVKLDLNRWGWKLPEPEVPAEGEET